MRGQPLGAQGSVQSLGRRTPGFSELHSSSFIASRVMRSNRSKGTRPEIALKRSLLRIGTRFKTHVNGLPGTPDFVFGEARVVVFCDGDFWHGRDWQRQRARLAKGANGAYWVAKIEYNMRRDRVQRSKLRALGWATLRCWESDVLRDPTRVALRIWRRVAPAYRPSRFRAH
jgi:DNA mismatch endonuclease (patch repair protein)